MPKSRDNSLSLPDLLNKFAANLTQSLSTYIERQVAMQVAQLHKSGKLFRSDGKVDGRRGGRLCPVPGCGQPGAGPRNRWFCKTHAAKLSAAEQKSVLERNKRLEAEGKLPAAIPATRVTRLPPKEKRARRSLDMSCRVEGCPNRSRGPRAGFICDMHRKELSPEEQKAARARWNDRVKGGAAPIQAVAEPKAPAPIAPVPPIVRKAEPPPAAEA